MHRPSSAANGIVGGNETQPSGHHPQEPSRRPHTATGGRGPSNTNGAMEQSSGGNGGQQAAVSACITVLVLSLAVVIGYIHSYLVL